MQSPLIFFFRWTALLYFSDHIFFKLQNLEKKKFRVGGVTWITHIFLFGQIDVLPGGIYATNFDRPEEQIRRVFDDNWRIVFIMSS